MRRRSFLSACAALGTSSLFGPPARTASDIPPETHSIRLVHDVAICFAPQYLAEELLRLEGITDVQWVTGPTAAYMALDADLADMTMDAAPAMVYATDRGSKLVALAGIHAGCYELFGNDRVQHVRDLKGKRIGIYGIGGGDHVLLSSMLAYVGIDPQTEVDWVLEPSQGEAMQWFIDGKTDAFLGFAPQPQELRKRKVGHVILNTAEDRPWSQYYCCALAANRDYVRKYPATTKRALRAFLMAAEVCAQEPERVARYLVDRGYEPRFDIALEVLRSLPYNRWRDSNPEDTMRFHALRLHEGGLIKASPQKIITQGTDWRFLNELKRELKS